MVTNQITDPFLLKKILSFLDAKSLAAADQTCTTLRGRSQQAWDSLYDAISYHDVHDTPLTKKQHVLRFLKQQRFARRMEHIADSHFDSEQQLQCPGCSEFPDIERDTFFDFAENDYFIRLSQKNDDNSSSDSDWVLLWEGGRFRDTAAAK